MGGPDAHFNLAGFKKYLWAVPLNEINYSVKSIVDEQNHIDACSAIQCFAKYINITTPIMAQQSLI